MRFLILGLLTLPMLALFAPPATEACDTLQTFRQFRAPAYAPACDCAAPVLQAPVYAPAYSFAPAFAPSYAPSCGVLQAPVYAPRVFAAPVYHAPVLRSPVYQAQAFRFRAFAEVYAPAYAPAAVFQSRTIIQRNRAIFPVFRGRTVIRERNVIGGGAGLSIRAPFFSLRRF